jgi:hypothetical protein
MKPDWDKLADSFANSKDKLIADVDCTIPQGESLCGIHGIQGFPTLKWGDPSDLQEYEGGRDYDSLKAFADDNLKPQCSPRHLDLCDADKKQQIQEYMQMDPETLKAEIDKKESAIEQLDQDFEQFIEGLQAQYEERSEQVQKEKSEIKQS